MIFDNIKLHKLDGSSDIPNGMSVMMYDSDEEDPNKFDKC